MCEKFNPFCRKKTMKKIRVGIIFGGKSAEHEVSLQSARNILDSIDKKKYETVLLGVDKSGTWHVCNSKNWLEHEDNPSLISFKKSKVQVTLIPDGAEGTRIINIHTGKSLEPLDVVFPIIHGPYGEDGSLQGLLKIANIPFVGAGVLGSAVGMDKDVMKRLLRDAGLPIGRFITIHSDQAKRIDFDTIAQDLGNPFFIKPANLGSSVGIHKVSNAKELKHALKDAFHYDTKVLLEEYIPGREIECAVLGNGLPVTSVLGEVVVSDKQDFYSYDAKYIDEDGAQLVLPVELPADIKKEIQRLAAETFNVLNCEGMGRVDIFLQKNGRIVINEINTAPGFTNNSMYPKLWEATGVSFAELIDKLIDIAIQRHEREQELKTWHD